MIPETYQCKMNFIRPLEIRNSRLFASETGVGSEVRDGGGDKRTVGDGDLVEIEMQPDDSEESTHPIAKVEHRYSPP